MSLPSLAVLTPIGPDHERFVERCTSSVKAARRLSSGPFGRITHLLTFDAEGEKGRSAARNELLKEAAGHFDWLFWLDADDEMAPEALKSLYPLETVFFDAVWGEIHAHGLGEAGPREGQRWPFTYSELLYGDPVRGLQIGYFVRSEVQAKHPWSEEMDTGEDFEMYLRLWAEHRCAKVSRRFYINHRGYHSHGPRSATGRQWRLTVERLQQRARSLTA